VDGVLSADPREVEGTVAMAFLSFQEATELAYFGAQVLHPQSMRPAMDSDALCVRVKNSYNVRAPGTLIGHERPGGSEDWLLTSIVRKKNVTMLDIVSTRMLGQYGFLAKVFNIMDKAGISVDCVATSEVSVSLTLDPAKVWSRDLVQEELDALVEEFENAGIARVKVTTGHSLISLIGNVERNNEIMQRGFKALGDADVKVQMISQGASKTNISLLVNDEQGSEAVNAIHHEFFPYEYGQILPSGDEDE
jgi:aspartate kinase